MAKSYQRPEFVNVFTLGMRGDIDPLFQDPKSFRYSLNGRIIFNTGSNFSWENLKGTRLSFNLPDTYRPIGASEMPDYLVVFSTNEVYSEIGLVVLNPDQTTTYTTIFNDFYDPNGQKFNFSFVYPIRAWSVIESPTKKRVYWTNAHDEMYVFNVVAGLQANNTEFTSGNYLPIAGNIYPWFYSVQQSQWYTDFAMGRIKFNRRTGTIAVPTGSLKTGVFQYAYSLGTREGYWAPWYPLTRHVMLTNIDLPGSPSAHDYYMVNSNVATPYSIELNLTGIDLRYYYIRIAYVYSIDKDATVESNIFLQEKIVPPLGSSRTFTHKDHSGTPVNLEDYNVYPVFLKKTTDIVEKDQRLWFCNLETDGDYTIDISHVTIKPIIRTYTGDDYGVVHTPPLTNSTVATTTIAIQSYLNSSGTPVTESYNVFADYMTYQGTQFEHLLTGYWRGETYPFGICWYNRKGIPFYIQNLKDYTFPQQYDLDDGGNPLILTDTFPPSNSPNQIRIMGALISGISVDNDFLYDNLGNLRVSGFSIVRCKRHPKTLYQAVLVPTVYDAFATGEEKYTRPMPMPSAYFDTANFYVKDDITYFTTYPEYAGKEYGNRPATYQLHSPEISFGFPVYSQTGQSGLQSSDVLKIVSEHQSAYLDVTVPPCMGDFGMIQLYATTNRHFYTKQYHTTIYVPGTYPMGMESRIQTINPIEFSNSATDPVQFVLSGYDLDNLALSFHGQSLFSTIACACNGHFDGLAPKGSQVVKTKDWNQAVAFGAYPSGTLVQPTYYLVNYVAASDQYYNDFNSDSINVRKYIGTGHFQPINATVLAQVVQRDGTYRFDGIEVWGGDCFVQFWDYLRIYPRYNDRDNCTPACAGPNVYIAYAVGMIVAIESNLNLSMRKGRSFASLGTETESDACGNSTVTLKGINVNQPEEFNLNSVLLHQENTQFFPGLPNNKDVTVSDFPNRWAYTPIKFYGELTDNYRRVLSNNFGDVIGLYGEIQGGVLWNNEVYSFQSRGWGRLRINDRSIISTINEEAVQTGAGETFGGIYYFSHNYGTQHIFSVLPTERAIYWVDVINRAIMRYGGKGQEIISDTKGQHDFANHVLDLYDRKTRNVTPFRYAWITTVNDRLNNEVTFVFANSQRNIADQDDPQNISVTFNENVDGFTTYNSYTPVFIQSFREFVFSCDNDNMDEVHIHGLGPRGSFYGTVYDSIITPIINPANNISKLYDNMVLNINHDGAESLDSVRYITEDQDFTQINFQTAAKQLFRYDDLIYALPLDPSNVRVSGKVLSTKFIFSNTANKIIKFAGLKTFFRGIKGSY